MTSQIVTADASTASAISGRVSAQALNAALYQYGLPAGNLQSVAVESTVPTVAIASVGLSGVIAGSVVGAAALFALLAVGACWYVHQQQRRKEALWLILPQELKYDDPPVVLGRGTFGMVLRAQYRGTLVAVKRVIPARGQATYAGEHSLQIASLGIASLDLAGMDGGGQPLGRRPSAEAGAGAPGTIDAPARRFTSMERTQAPRLTSMERTQAPEPTKSDSGGRASASISPWAGMRWRSVGSGAWRVIGCKSRGADVRAMYRDFVEEMTLLSK